MANGIYMGVGDAARKINGLYVGANDVARKVTKAYVGVNGVARQVWPGGDTLGSKAIGDIVKISLDGLLWDFIVVHKGNPDPSLYDASFNDGVILLMKDVYITMAMNPINGATGGNDYSLSYVHSYLNGEFLQSFSPSVLASIKTVIIPYRPGIGASLDASGRLAARAFLPSTIEYNMRIDNYDPLIGAVFSYFEGTLMGWYTINPEPKRVAYYNGNPISEYFTRTPGVAIGDPIVAYYAVAANGGSSWAHCYGAYGMRPALVLPSSLLVAGDGTVLA